jgi:dTDP-4-amino-4,6-dideoxygalactose transaminase
MILPKAYDGHDHIWNQYTVRVPGAGRRDRLKAHLTECGIGTEIYYPVPMHRQECFAFLKADRNQCPVADQLAAECLSIPIFPELSQPGQDAVIAAIKEFLVRNQD